MNVGSELVEAQLEHLATADEAAAGKESGREYFNPDTGEILVGDGLTLIRFKKAEDSIGDMKHSMLTEAQFQAEVDASWVLADGRSVAGSDFHVLTGFSIVPDCRGQFLRGANNGRADGYGNPDGGLVLGLRQDDKFKQHVHEIRSASGAGAGRAFPFPSDNGTLVNEVTLSTGAAETRPRNITVNIFIKINRLP